jgi:hypothetical protein
MTQFFKRHILMLTISELALAASLEDVCKDLYCTKVSFARSYLNENFSASS